MSDTVQPPRPSFVPAVFITVAGVCEMVGSYFMSLSGPNLFPFAVMFTAAVVLMGVAVYSWHEYLSDPKAADKGAGAERPRPIAPRPPAR